MVALHGKYAGILVDNNQPTIFVNQRNIRIVGENIAHRLHHLDTHAGMQNEVELTDAFAVDGEKLFGQKTLDFVAAQVFDVGIQKLKQLNVLVNLQCF